MIVLTDPCARGSLQSAAKCFDCLSPSQKQKAIVWFKARALLALGGTDYTNKNTLNIAAKCFKCEAESQLDSFEVAIAQQLALDSGAASVTFQQLKAALKCWECESQSTVYADKVFLDCQLEQKQKPILI